jgi:hypothetical protein
VVCINEAEVGVRIDGEGAKAEVDVDVKLPELLNMDG